MPHAHRRRPAPRFARVALTAAVGFGGTLLAVAAPAEPAANPAWQALPAETIAAFQMPDTQGFLEAFRANTIAGQRIFTQERFDQIQQLIQQYNQQDWDEMVAGLEEYGFTPDDLLKIAQSNWGLGFVGEERGDALPRMMMIGWADLADADIDRLYAALDQAEAQSEGPRRTDFEVQGVPARHYAVPEMGMDREADWNTPDGFFELSQEDQQKYWDEQQKINDAAEYTKVDETHLILARTPGRIILALGFPQSKDAVRELIAAGQDIDWDNATDAQTVKDMLSEFLGTLDVGAEDGFARRVHDDPNIAATVGHNQPLFEFFVDAPRAMNVIQAAILSEEGPESADKFNTVVQTLGFEGLGVAAGSGYFENNALQVRSFAQMQGPRTGLLATLDGQTMPAAPPAWVPAGVTYGHLAYDLSKLYDVVIAAVQEFAGPDVMQQVMMGNMIVNGQIQADIPTVLRDLGTQHSMIALESREVTFTSQEYDFDTQTMNTVENTMAFQPIGLVWELADAETWARIVAAGQNFAPMAGPDSGIEVVNDQGFTGLAITQGPLPVSVMTGQGKLVLGIGPEVTDQTLSLINNPPADSLAESDLFREGGTLINYLDGIAFIIQDAGQGMVDAKGAFVDGFQNGMKQASPEDAVKTTELLDSILQVLPSDEDLQASFGVSVGQMRMTDNGLIYEGAVGTPAAE